jgi:hypothetical protein
MRLDAERDLAAVLVDAEEQAARASAQHEDADHLAAGDDGPDVMDPDVRRPAQPFERVARLVVAALAQHGSGLPHRPRGDFGQVRVAPADVASSQHHRAVPSIRRTAASVVRAVSITTGLNAEAAREARGSGGQRRPGIGLLREHGHRAQVDGRAFGTEGPGGGSV